MAINDVMQTGKSGMVAAKTAIATTGHNITNANTPGFSRQRVITENVTPVKGMGTNSWVGRGTKVARVERVNDEYIEKQLRGASRDMSMLEEKDLSLQQLEDIFNEMDGDGLNRLVSSFFNEFRKLASDPDNEALRQSVREASLAMANDFKRLRKEVVDVQNHIDARIESYAGETNTLGEEIRELNHRIQLAELGGHPANDLLDKRDKALMKLSDMMSVQIRFDKENKAFVDIKQVGPFITGPISEKLMVARTPADDEGKPENALDITTTASASPNITHRLEGGKLGALLETRDRTLSKVINRLDEMAYTIAKAVNEVHRQGFTRNGIKGVNFFEEPAGRGAAAEYLTLSDAVKANVNNIATAGIPHSPGDNRIAVAISGIQKLNILNEGQATLDDFYNSMVADVGVTRHHTTQLLNQQKNIMTQLEKVRDQISGVSIDEETMNLMQFQHSFDASAKVIKVADEMLQTVLSLKE